jgi:acyl-CoA synthetase (AMP-forming)/AMP-acid ligase II
MTLDDSREHRPSSANVAHALVDAWAGHPDRPALLGRDGRVRWTFAELTDLAARIASGLLQRGLRPGGRVVLLVRDPEAALVIAAATLWAGGTLVAPPGSGGWRAALHAARQTRPTVVVADAATWPALAVVPELATAHVRVATGRRRWPGLVTIDELAAGHQRSLAEPVSRSADAAALVSWTTGTTGWPHAVVRTHGVMAAQHTAIRRLRAPLPGDVDLVGLPTMALHDLACGVPMVLAPRGRGGRDGACLRDLVASAAVTTAVGFPVLFERLVDGAGPAALPGLRSIHLGGAPVPRELLDRLATVAPNAIVVVVYGATEAEPIAAIDAAELRSPGANRTAGVGLLVGRPCAGIEVRLDPVGELPGRGPLTNARRGRILLRGDRVANDPVRSSADGWLDLGDVGRFDGDGRLWLLGRTSNALPDGWAPAEVEEPTTELPGVRAAALVSMPGRGNQRHVLAVEPAANSSATDVQARVASLARDRGWRLDRIAVVPRIPVDARSGKTDYLRLRTTIRGTARIRVIAALARAGRGRTAVLAVRGRAPLEPPSAAGRP